MIEYYKITAKWRIAFLLKHSRPKAFEKKEPKKYKANFEILKRNSRQRSDISNPHNQRHEEDKKEESDEMKIDLDPIRVNQRDQIQRQPKKYAHSRCEDFA